MELKMNPNRKLSLPAVTVLTVLMASFLYLLTVARSTGLDGTASWIFFSYFLILYILMMSTGRISYYRRIFFVTAAVIMIPAFIAILYETRGSMAATYETVLRNQNPLCPIVIPIAIIPYLVTKTVIYSAKPIGGYASMYSMLLIWALATLFLGRGWCSWVCFYGGWTDGFSRVSKKPRLSLNWQDARLKYLNFAILAFVVLASLVALTSVYCEWLCPFKLITEYNANSYIATILFITIFFGGVVALPVLTRKRFQCTSFCPLGAFQTLLEPVSPYKVSIDTEKCSQCMKCVRECPNVALTEEIIKEKKGRPLQSCTKCAECMDVCPRGAIGFTFFHCREHENKNMPSQTGKAHFPAGIVKTIGEILSPQALLTFTGFLLGTVVASAFGTGTILRIINLFIHGSFLLK